MRTYVYQEPRHDEQRRQPRQWFVTDGVSKTALTPEEEAAIMGTVEHWIADYGDDMDVVSVRITPNGWKSAVGDGPRREGQSRAITCVGYASRGTYKVRRFIRPDGTKPDILRVRFVTGDVVTEVPFPYTQEAMDSEVEIYGSRVAGGSHLAWVATKSDLHVTRIVGECPEFETPLHNRLVCADARARLAILRAFRCYPIRQHVWKGATEETEFRVEARWNDRGPWKEVDAKGRF